MVMLMVMYREMQLWTLLGLEMKPRFLKILLKKNLNSMKIINMDKETLAIDTIPDAAPAIMSKITADEPYFGQEFDSEAAAHAFYNAYATRTGFVIRVSKLSRSRRDGSAIGRALVCNKEGFRMPDKREKDCQTKSGNKGWLQGNDFGEKNKIW
ncbi:FAR-RED IMPAIRED RESPONSIVE (FAR1) FAMILY PROTEIN [Salix purpurea]|uniref:FAR-RED IMPAIRED RESPONSIVE (FAR1) FAMILY PROTEIN n=1 Tax=Salix purpurea TaxID=77065 RepID=A0A9Q0V300_SALPP|nr:FAR-RED IMPAIRED RESPONSIVE (FAR1) FAMILY PROTEIN [Salix purpurea]